MPKAKTASIDIARVRQARIGYTRLERANCTEEEWLMLKFSLETEREAREMIAADNADLTVEARRKYAKSDDIEVEDGASVSRGADDGWWVTARVWVPDTEGT